MKARHMHVNIQSRIKKVRVKARCIDFWQQFPSIIMNIRVFIFAHQHFLWQDLLTGIKIIVYILFNYIFVNSVNEVQILCVLTAYYVISEMDKVPSSEYWQQNN